MVVNIRICLSAIPMVGQSKGKERNRELNKSNKVKKKKKENDKHA